MPARSQHAKHAGKGLVRVHQRTAPPRSSSNVHAPASDLPVTDGCASSISAALPRWSALAGTEAVDATRGNCRNPAPSASEKTGREATRWATPYRLGSVRRPAVQPIPLLTSLSRTHEHWMVRRRGVSWMPTPGAFVSTAYRAIESQAYQCPENGAGNLATKDAHSRQRQQASQASRGPTRRRVSR